MRIGLVDGLKTPVGPSLERPMRTCGTNCANCRRGAAVTCDDHTEIVVRRRARRRARKALPCVQGQGGRADGDSADRTRLSAWVTAPDAPPAWYLYDRARKELSPLREEYPELKGATFGPTRWIAYKARDGLALSGYLTLPSGARPEEPAPGGVPAWRPGGRATSRFRLVGSGDGVEGLCGAAGELPRLRRPRRGLRAKPAAGEWGRKMQTDLSDGVRCLAAQGTIDPQRVCIVGASYGGYAAMAGPTLDPGVYRLRRRRRGHLGCRPAVRRLGPCRPAQHRRAAVLDPLHGAAGAEGPAADAAIARQSRGRRHPRRCCIHGEEDTVDARSNKTQIMVDALMAPPASRWTSSSCEHERPLATRAAKPASRCCRR